MGYEVLKILMDYSSKKRLLDFKAICQIIDIYLETYNAYDYCQQVEVQTYNKNPKTSMSYNSYYKIITIYFQNLWGIINRKDYNNDPNQWFYKNSYILAAVLHELEHVYQEKTRVESSDNFLTTLLEYEKYVFVSNPYDNYEKTYYLNPAERSADILSTKELIRILGTSGDYPQHTEHLKNRLKEMEADDYQKRGFRVMCPTELYFRLNLNYPLWERLKTDFSLQKVKSSRDFAFRVTYGLPIASNEYNILKEKSLSLR